MALPVAAANALTARWAATLDGRSTAFSGLCLWPLLALLRIGADDATRAELEAAVGSADPAELLDTLRDAPAIEAALGLWSRTDLPLNDAWLQHVPAHARGRLHGDEQKDRKALDQWANDNTGGLIERMPVDSLDRVRLLLASAIAVRTRWEQPFAESAWTPDEGPWKGRPLTRLRRSGPDLDQVTVTRTEAGPLSIIRCPGQ
ncbi:MAG TPA: serpin family protein, partial [Mycobacteriales bacterium]|nr:serpin family protein [Mycobacteriales bacterium]